MNGNVQSNTSSNLEIAQSNQDLIMNRGKHKGRLWCISGLICITVVVLVAAAITLIVLNKQNAQIIGKSQPLTLEDILSAKINPIEFNATWVSGNELIYRDIDGNLVLKNVENPDNSTKTLLNFDEPLLAKAAHFSLSSDKAFLLISYDLQPIYRHSYKAKYTIIDLNTTEKFNLSVNDNYELLLAVWSTVGNALAFVYDNNIYYKNSVRSEMTVQITKDNNLIYNGIPDWVYEEEVFSSNKALWFSPDGKKLAYCRFDDRNTPIMVIPIYGQPGNLLFQYPRAQVIRYPKAGTTNPLVSLHFVELENATTINQLMPPTTLSNKEPIISTVAWANNDFLTAIWMNRIQNEAAVVAYQTVQPYRNFTIKDLNQTDGWLELFKAPYFSDDGTQLALLLSQPQGSAGSFRHLVLLNLKENSETQALTQGTFVVTDIIGWNSDNNNIYYLANTENDTALQHLYSISVETKQIQCVSCHLQSKCLYNTAKFSPDSSHYTLTCEGPDVPTVSLHSISKKLIQWETNSALKNFIENRTIPKVIHKTFEIADGFRAHVSMKLPPNFDSTGMTQYPLLINVYGGPDSYQVLHKFDLDWGSYLASNKSIIYATIDGRGSGLKGDKILFSLYRHLGSVEIIDQINVTRQMQETLPYIDPKRTAVWGWSYGGYAAGMILANDTQNTFKCGISVAPVTDWALYDSIYTERFMGLPTNEDNLKGYQESSLLSRYEGIRNKDYFLIHGTSDDNVHYQQSMLWAEVLEHNDILFRQLSYTDQNHGLSFVRPHLYHSLEQFLDECFAVS